MVVFIQTGQVLGRVNVVSGHVKTQLIAHDKEVYDIAFSRAGGGRDMFASVGKSQQVMCHTRSSSCITMYYSLMVMAKFQRKFRVIVYLMFICRCDLFLSLKVKTVFEMMYKGIS